MFNYIMENIAVLIGYLFICAICLLAFVAFDSIMDVFESSNSLTLLQFLKDAKSAINAATNDNIFIQLSSLFMGLLVMNISWSVLKSLNSK